MIQLRAISATDLTLDVAFPLKARGHYSCRLLLSVARM